MRIHRYTYLYVYNTWWFRYILYNICIKRIYIKYYPKYNIKCIKIQALSFIREYIETSKYDKGYDIISVVAGARAGIDASDTATSTLEAWWDGVWRLYLEVVEIVHDLIVVHVEVVEAERLRRVGARLAFSARVHRVPDDRCTLHFWRTATLRDNYKLCNARTLTLSSILIL